MPSPFASRVKIELLTGLVAGIVFLGVGGRLAMRVIALANGAAPTVSPSGTFNVVLLGAATGLGGAIIHLILVKNIRRHVLREATFGLILSLVTGRGLSGQMSVPASLFFVLVGLYGITLVMVSRKHNATNQ